MIEHSATCCVLDLCALLWETYTSSDTTKSGCFQMFLKRADQRHHQHHHPLTTGGCTTTTTMSTLSSAFDSPVAQHIRSTQHRQRSTLPRNEPHPLALQLSPRLDDDGLYSPELLLP